MGACCSTRVNPDVITPKLLLSNFLLQLQDFGTIDVSMLEDMVHKSLWQLSFSELYLWGEFERKFSVLELVRYLRTGTLVQARFGIDIEQVATFVHVCQRMRHEALLVDLGSNDFELASEVPNWAPQLTSLLQNVQEVVELDLSWNDVRITGAQVVGASLVNMPNLRRLSLAGNKIGDEGLQALSKGLMYTPQLESLDISDNKVTSEGIQTLGVELHNVPLLRFLSIAGDVYSAGLCDSGAEFLCSHIQACEAIQTLSLARNSIAGNGVTALVDCAPQTSKLQYLDLETNRIGLDVEKLVNDAMPHWPALQFLNVAENGLGPLGTQILATGMAHLTQLTSLNLSGNDIENDGATALAQCLHAMTNLRSLKLDRNSIDTKGGKVLGQHLEFASSLRVFSIISNDVDDKLMTGVEKLSQLQCLSLSRTLITKISAKVCSLPALRMWNVKEMRFLAEPPASVVCEGIVSAKEFWRAMSELSLAKTP